MEKTDKDKIMAKWQPILDRLNVDKSKQEMLAEYAEMHDQSMKIQANSTPEAVSSLDNAILPMSIKIAKAWFDFDIKPVPGEDSPSVITE